MIWPDIDFFGAHKKRKEFMVLFLVVAKQLQGIV